MMNEEIKRLLISAQGYMELGMWKDGIDALESLPPKQRQHPGVQQMRLTAKMHLKQWREALEIAERLCRIKPEETGGFLHAAFCLHELGRTGEAKGVLLSGPKQLLEEATYHYNLGCYEAVLGNDEEALRYLRRSFELDEKLRDVAASDPDLAALRARL